jgi:DNA-3-methyladenine glycosylase II
LAEVVATLGDAAFAAAGVSRQKREYLRGLAAASLAEPALYDRLEHLPDEAVIAALTAIKGIGRWTADMYLIFVLGRLDILPLGDLSIRAAMTELHGLKRETKPQRLMALAEAWRPYRSVACWYLYRYLDGRPTRPTNKPAKPRKEKRKGKAEASGSGKVSGKIS